MSQPIADPLGVVRVIADLERRIGEYGLTLSMSSDFHALAALRMRLRGDQLTPMFDPSIAELTSDGAFWISMQTAEGRVVGYGAYRMDTVGTSLADWASGWMIGHHMRRGELVVPSHNRPPPGSLTERLRGRIVYFGELWHDPEFRKRGLLQLFPRFGLFLCYVKWHPDAVWSLAAERMSMTGGMVKLGYPRLERNFLRWSVPPEGAESSDWVAIATAADLEYMLADELTRHGK